MKLIPDDTICALATPAGRGGIGVIRLSGSQTFAIVDGVCRAKNRKPSNQRRSATLYRANAVDVDGSLIDDVFVAVFRAPKSYTGEDVAEISAHGGPAPLRRILARLFDLGARHAGPGEFTQRSFLNGKIDLAQAEAVADVIEADTDEAHRLAVSQQAGRLSREVLTIRDILLGVMARIEASIDFPEDVGELDTAECRGQLLIAAEKLDCLLSTADAGILTREGIKVALIGRPNVGKSSLMNALLRADRSIVTPIPGTTRDIVEEGANIKGVRVRFIDTAGMRDTDDVVEKLGVERSKAGMESADLVLLVLDASTGETREDSALRALLSGRPCVEVWNKWDLVNLELPSNGVAVSAATGWHLEAVEDAIIGQLTAGVTASEAGAAVVTHSRHRHALRSARARVDDAVATIDGAMPPDFISIDVHGALVALGEITGETATDDIINEIFSRFCIGK